MIVTPSENDVLCGRGKYSFHHKGNKQFRVLIAEHVENYRMAETKKLKMGVVSIVVDTVLSRGGHFLIQDSQGFWRDGGKNHGKKKTGNALRDAQRGRIKCLSIIQPFDFMGFLESIDQRLPMTKDSFDDFDSISSLISKDNSHMNESSNEFALSFFPDVQRSLVSFEHELLNPLRLENDLLHIEGHSLSDEPCTNETSTDWIKKRSRKNFMHDIFNEFATSQLHRIPSTHSTNRFCNSTTLSMNNYMMRPR